MTAKIQLVGGPRDGQWVSDYGPEFREPVHQEVRLFVASPEIAHLDFPTIHDGPKIARYEKRIDAGDGRPRYLYRGT